MKEKVLEILKNNLGENISGAQIASSLGVSRAAVWKAIEELRSDGYIIEAHTKKGYSLQSIDHVIDPEEIKKYLATQRFARHIEFFDEVASTNDVAKDRAREHASEGTLVIAKHQNAGRGRYSRTFHSPDNGSIYMSLLLRPLSEFKDTSLLTVIAAAAVALAIDEVCGVETKIKWVNDVYVNNKKICGILTEAGYEMETSSISYIVIGIGININAKYLPQELMNKASGIREHAGKNFSVNLLIAQVMNLLENYYLAEDKRTVLGVYRAKSFVLGETVMFEKAGKETQGVAKTIDNDGGLIISLADGRSIKLQSGEVSIRLK